MKDVNPKLIAIISYLTFVGWIVAFVLNLNNREKYSLSSFHLRQSLGLLLTYLLLGPLGFFISTIPYFGWIFSTVVYIFLILLIVLGILYAASEQEKTVPIVGIYYQEIFKNVS